MNIGIDIRYASKNVGMGKFVRQLVTGLININTSNQYFLYSDIPWKPDKELPANFHFIFKKALNYVIWEQIYLPLRIKKDKIDLFHFPANTGSILLPISTKVILTLHDVMFLKSTSELSLSPSIKQNTGRLYRSAVVKRLVRKTSLITTDSLYSNRDIKKLLSIPSDKVKVIYLAANDCCLSSTSDASPIKDNNQPYFLALGAIDPRKNTKLLVEAYGDLKKELPNSPKLVIAGMKNPKICAAYRYAEEFGLLDSVIFTGVVSDERLLALYRNAECFIFPSLYEGFGLPILEAMGFGIPVLASNTTSIPEAGGEAPLYFNPTDRNEMKKTMLTFLDFSPSQKDAMTKNGLEQVQKFSWKQTAQEYYNLYQKLSA